VNDDLSLETPTTTISRKDMEEIAKQYAGANRIHKPMALLFWSDVKNGQKSNWK
jgi:hypothetical protein